MLDVILQNLLHLEFKFNFATNSIGFTFTEKNSEQKGYRLWLEPFWRFIKDEQLVLSSATCPWHEDYETKENYDTAFRNWYHKVEYLKSIPIKNIQRIEGINDLLIEWADGTQLFVYQDNTEREQWYVHDKNCGVYYLVLAGGVVEEKGEVE